MIINDLFPDYGRTVCNTGNLYITGLEKMGAGGCFLQLVDNVQIENNPIFYFDSHLSREKKQQIINNATSKGYRVFDINNISCHMTPFDLLSAFETIEEKANILYSFLSDKSDSLDFINQIHRYFQDCIISLNSKCERISFEEILNLSIENVKNDLRSSREWDDSKIENEISFLESKDAYRNWGVINDRARKIKLCGMVDILSGKKSVYEVFDKKTLLLINQRTGADDSAKIYLALSNGVVCLLGNLCEKRNYYNEPYHIFIKNCTEIKSSSLEMLLDVTMNAPFALPLCIFDQSVTKTIDIHPSFFLDYFGAFAIFKNNEGAFWSKFLGTALTPDRTETYSRKRSPILVSTGGVVPRRTSKYEGTTVHRIEMPLYEARVFPALKERSLIFYNVYLNRKARKQLSW